MQGFFNRAVMLGVVSAAQLFSADAPSPFSGRWDLTIITSKGMYPSWLEFADEAGTPDVRMVGRTGSVHAVRDPKVDGAKLTFADGPGQWQVTVKDHKLTGQAPEGSVSGVPAPALNHAKPGAWSIPVPLFNGHDLS